MKIWKYLGGGSQSVPIIVTQTRVTGTSEGVAGHDSHGVRITSPELVPCDTWLGMYGWIAHCWPG